MTPVIRRWNPKYITRWKPLRLLYSHFVRQEMLLVVIACAVTSGCGWQPGVYAAPPQRSLELGLNPGGLGAFINMEDPTAPEYIVRDISSERGIRRWAFL